MDITPKAKPTENQFNGAVAYFEDANDRQAQREADLAKRDARHSKAGNFIAMTLAAGLLAAAGVAGLNALVSETDTQARQGETASHVLADRPHDPIQDGGEAGPQNSGLDASGSVVAAGNTSPQP